MNIIISVSRICKVYLPNYATNVANFIVFIVLQCRQKTARKSNCAHACGFLIPVLILSIGFYKKKYFINRTFCTFCKIID
ncbi:MAG TPA: hypothetical protein DCS37_04175 [Clostridiales bacterium]|nr:hypothetical protein [Clostridiales bacterium]